MCNCKVAHIWPEHSEFWDTKVILAYKGYRLPMVSFPSPTFVGILCTICLIILQLANSHYQADDRNHQQLKKKITQENGINIFRCMHGTSKFQSFQNVVKHACAIKILCASLHLGTQIKQSINKWFLWWFLRTWIHHELAQRSLRSRKVETFFLIKRLIEAKATDIIKERTSSMPTTMLNKLITVVVRTGIYFMCTQISEHKFYS